jgi:type I restriction enzyme M protein
MTNAKSRSASTKRWVQPGGLRPAIAAKLKDTPEQHGVVGPVVERLCEIGWSLEQIVFGKSEWRVPKSPSEQTKREKGKTFLGFPVDIAVFDDPTNSGDPRHLLFMIECKQPDETAGVSQLEGYFVAEPHAQLGVWANNAAPGSAVAFLFASSAESVGAFRLR